MHYVVLLIVELRLARRDLSANYKRHRCGNAVLDPLLYSTLDLVRLCNKDSETVEVF